MKSKQMNLNVTEKAGNDRETFGEEARWMKLVRPPSGNQGLLATQAGWDLYGFIFGGFEAKPKWAFRDGPFITTKECPVGRERFEFLPNGPWAMC